MLILNTRLVENGIITPLDEENRTKKDEKHRLSIREQFSEIVDYIKQESFDKGDDVFYPLRVGWIKSSFQFAETNDILTLIFRLKNDPNIICKEEEITGEGVFDKRSQLYRWVPAEVKEEMGFDAVAYRNIPAHILEYLKTDFKDYSSKPSEILAVLDRMILEGADRGWIVFSPLRICGRTGIPLSVVQNVLDDLDKNGCIYLYEQSKEFYKNRKPCVVVLAFTEEDKQIRLQQAESQNIEIFAPLKKTRASRKSVYIKKEHLLNEVKANLITSSDMNQKVQKPEEEKMGIILNLFDKTDVAVKTPETIPDELNDLNTFCTQQKRLLNNLVKNMTYAFSKKEETLKNENSHQIAELTQKVLSVEAKMSEKEDQIKRLKNRLEQEKNLNKEFMVSLTEALAQFQGGLMTVIEDFSRKPSYLKNEPREISKFKMQVFNLSQNLSDELIKWDSKDKKVPNAI